MRYLVIFLLFVTVANAVPFGAKNGAARKTTSLGSNATPATIPYTIQADAWLSFENGTNNQSFNTNYMTTNIVGVGLGSWIESPDKVFNPLITTNFTRQLPAYIVLNGVTNTDLTGTRGCSIDCNTNTQYWFQVPFVTSQDTVSMAGWFYTTIPTDGSNFATYDFWWFYSADGSQWSVAQFQNGSLRAHCADSGSNNNGKGNNITFSSGTWYYLVLYYYRGASSTLEVYDTSLNLVGTSVCVMGTSVACANTRFGSGGHGQQNAKFIYMDNLSWKFTNNFTYLRPK